MKTTPLFPDYDDLSSEQSTETNPLSVSQVTSHIRQLIEENEMLMDVWMEGEVSNLRLPSSGHMYFTIKDNDAQMRCVMWRSDVERVNFDVQDHDQVLINGKISVYEKGGQYQLYVRKLRPVGAGDLNRQLQMLYNKLNAEGLFTPDNKQSIPALPQRIGIVTSESTAALQDVLNVLRRRYPLGEVILSPTPVQGDTAAPQIVQAIEALNKHQAADVILLVRGGGSLEDLWCFNDEAVVRAVVDSQIPVVSGIGHEIDNTLVDYAADLRAPTPSAAAELATPSLEGLRKDLDGFSDRAYNAFATSVSERRGQLVTVRKSLKLLTPQSDINTSRQRTDDMVARLGRAMQGNMAHAQAKYDMQVARLKSNDPMSILSRGYAVVTRQGDGQRIAKAKDAAMGTALVIQMTDGILEASVKARTITPEKPPKLTPLKKGTPEDISPASV